MIRLIDFTTAKILTKKSIRPSRLELARITDDLNWLIENEKIHYLEQIDSSGKETTSFQASSPGVPTMLSDVEKELAIAREKFEKLEGKFFSQKGHSANTKRLIITAVVGLFTIAGFFISYGSNIRNYLFELLDF